MKAVLPCLPLLLLAACDPLPRDPAGSSERIRATHLLRVGVAQGEPDFGRAAAARLLGRLARQTGARPHIRPGSTEPLLMALERGDLDLVLTPLDPKSPWMTRVSLSPPLAARGEGERRITYHAVLRNGENRWIMTVEQAARRAADPGVEP
jgi:hypothetical protein